MSPRGRVVAGVGVSLGLAVGVLLGFLIMKLGHASDQIEALDSAGLSRDRAISALASGDSQLRSQVKALGGTPQVPPPQVIISGVAGAQGIQGPGPSDAQVASAVAAYLTAHPVPGASTAQIAAAVTAYLIATPPPSGPPGPGPSDQQVANAVASYLQANPPPSGPPGADGKDGANGSPPAGWSFEVNGTPYDCVPDSGTPAPHYTCPPQPTASASPGPSTAPTGSTPPPPTTAAPAPSQTPLPTATTIAMTTPASFVSLVEDPLRPIKETGRRGFLLLGVPFYRRGL